MKHIEGNLISCFNSYFMSHYKPWNFVYLGSNSHQKWPQVIVTTQIGSMASTHSSISGNLLAQFPFLFKCSMILTLCYSNLKFVQLCGFLVFLCNHQEYYHQVIFTNESNIERWKKKRQVAVDSKIGRLNNFIKQVKVPMQVVWVTVLHLLLGCYQ